MFMVLYLFHNLPTNYQVYRLNISPFYFSFLHTHVVRDLVIILFRFFHVTMHPSLHLYNHCDEYYNYHKCIIVSQLHIEADGEDNNSNYYTFNDESSELMHSISSMILGHDDSSREDVDDSSCSFGSYTMYSVMSLVSLPSQFQV